MSDEKDATPSDVLWGRLMDSRIPKSELEWYAKRHIEQQRDEIARLEARVAEQESGAVKMLPPIKKDTLEMGRCGNHCEACAQRDDRIAEQDAQIAALQQRVHLCAGYDKLEARVKELEADAEQLSRYRTARAALDRKEGE